MILIFLKNGRNRDIMKNRKNGGECSTCTAEREDEASERSLASLQRAWVEVKTPQA